MLRFFFALHSASLKFIGLSFDSEKNAFGKQKQNVQAAAWKWLRTCFSLFMILLNVNQKW